MNFNRLLKRLVNRFLALLQRSKLFGFRSTFIFYHKISDVFIIK